MQLQTNARTWDLPQRICSVTEFQHDLREAICETERKRCFNRGPCVCEFRFWTGIYYSVSGLIAITALAVRNKRTYVRRCNFVASWFTFLKLRHWKIDAEALQSHWAQAACVCVCSRVITQQSFRFPTSTLNVVAKMQRKAGVGYTGLD